MRDQINLLSEKDYLYQESNHFALTPLGSYYIVDKASRKILYYNNYGKLNYIIYHPDYRFDSDKGNPKYLDKQWIFGEISQIAANMDRLYVVSSALPQSSPREYTKKAQVVLAFDNKGEFLYQIGSAGIDSEPFLFTVVKLFIDSQGRLFVITRQTESYQIYRFSSEGRLISKFVLSVAKTIFSDKSFQLTQKTEEGIGKGFLEIHSPQLSYDGKYLFFELYHYIAEINQVTAKTKRLITNAYHIYSINTQSPDKSLKKNFTVWAMNRKNQKIPSQTYGEQLLGTTENGLLVLLQNREKHILVYYEPDGEQKHIVNIVLSEKHPYQLNLAANGLLSGLYFYEDRVAINWWRTDTLINSEISF